RQDGGAGQRNREDRALHRPELGAEQPRGVEAPAPRRARSAEAISSLVYTFRQFDTDSKLIPHNRQ
ncbi:MAG: hypothetical protein DA329_03780, partial [Candidatus Nitrosocosmicus sp.]|nr:hypothetical protein [Candidatus Nitrosocosmicus sp.]